MPRTPASNAAAVSRGRRKKTFAHPAGGDATWPAAFSVLARMLQSNSRKFI
jgi:hypothetical protein